MDFADAVVLAARVYGASRDRSGGLHLTHCVNVAQALGRAATPTAMSAAVLHDVPEDSGCTIEDLATWGVDPVVCEVVDVSTLAHRWSLADLADAAESASAQRVSAPPG